MTSDQEIISRITQKVNESLPIWFGAGTCLLSSQPERVDRSYTIILIYTAVSPDTNEVRLVLKLPRENWMGSLEEIIVSEEIRASTIKRAEILRGIENAAAGSGNPKLTAIRIYDVYPEYCTIVMEWRKFTTLKRLFFQSPVYLKGHQFFQSVDQQVFTVGQWVKLFHDTFGQPEDKTTGQLDQISNIKEMIDRIEQLTGKGFQTLKQQFIKKHEQVRDISNPISFLHNDLTFNNIFLTEDGQIGGFDPTPEPPGSIYQDLARLLTFCATSNQQVATQGLFYGSRYPRQVEASFLRGYGSEIDPPLLNFFCASLVLEKWLEFEQEDLYKKSVVTSLPGARTLLRPHINRYFHNLALDYLSH